MKPLVNTAIQAAREAGNLLVRGLQRIDALTIDTKGRNDFATEIDRMAEAAIIGKIRSFYPGHAFLGEETGTSGSDESDVTWIIDPLDGTLNFLQGIPHFAVSIAVQKGNHLEHGVIVDPIRRVG